jgi:hypothetical protein
MATDLGSDYSTFRSDGSYGLTYRRISGARVPLERVARRWLTIPGDLPWDRTAGVGIHRLLNADLTAARLAVLRNRLASEAALVDFVTVARVDCTIVGDSLRADGLIALADGGSHPLLLTATEASVLFRFPTLS